ncbi:ethanolamine utilization protein EutN [Rhodobium orientis]|uniref:Ethanolamine utilization protein EutN n=1 Tax=Rhodobium orientis TaxID=34017 RepID=A0A327JJU0_9HYPH|nr:EutN/CcmL family microcompartment protein [Rhodobium orientis]MBB4301448.1 ethanolamine utilization protein EutN [Rhodobium orientis]MBK5950965.1 ethanolamine utilization protein EutN [Rhodobium orientis]RAI25062.1 ethanolamine utilization protein EutN [Rhodobium orientis]
MHLGRVIGTVVSTSKDATLAGSKLLIVARLTEKQEPDGFTEIATDTVGAGYGEIVIVTTGSAARQTGTLDRSVTDASIVGIVDSVETH